MSETDISIINLKVDNLSETVTEFKQSIKELTVAVTKLTLVEERQIQAEQRQSSTLKLVEQAFTQIDSLKERATQLEIQVPANKRVSVWVDRAIWAAAGLLAMMVLKKTGVI
jgi:hypothetical protein